MQSGSVEIAPGKVFNEQDGETVDLEKLNRMVREAVLRVMAKSITAREIADNAITSDQLDVKLSAQLGVPDGSVTTGKLAAGFVMPVAKGGTGSTSSGSARLALGCLRTDMEVVLLTGGTVALSQSDNGTYTYNLADFTGAGLDPDEIRMLWVRVHRRAASGSSTEVFATFPDGTERTMMYVSATSTGFSEGFDSVVPVPVKPGQSSVDFRILHLISGGGGFDILYATQRVFEGY